MLSFMNYSRLSSVQRQLWMRSRTIALEKLGRGCSPVPHVLVASPRPFYHVCVEKNCTYRGIRVYTPVAVRDEAQLERVGPLLRDTFALLAAFCQVVRCLVLPA